MHTRFIYFVGLITFAYTAHALPEEYSDFEDLIGTYQYTGKGTIRIGDHSDEYTMHGVSTFKHSEGTNYIVLEVKLTTLPEHFKVGAMNFEGTTTDVQYKIRRGRQGEYSAYSRSHGRRGHYTVTILDGKLRFDKLGSAKPNAFSYFELQFDSHGLTTGNGKTYYLFSSDDSILGEWTSSYSKAQIE